MKINNPLWVAVVAAGTLSAPAAFATEHPAGEAITMNGMQIAAVYLEPIEMEPRGMGLPPAKADVHLETDIHAVQGNKNGFGAGEWMPYLTISYSLVNTDTGDKQDGTFMAMVANDGPHYGQNVKMMGVGNYKVTFHIEPPPKAGMYRHTDTQTGVGPWWKPFDVTYNFKYVGLK
ncbi:iron transporter [Acerihabitans sp. TG2]|uniref:iron transporter n=1 Tax=Acerihabitans sp. TG2 TaxID=3096008 RepID=UPI002B227AEA|nr:iron transporter [Acerihabitans sp. TG2]MEA9389162.1 iron transporter [Acerihabitans sp. TG2]